MTVGGLLPLAVCSSGGSGVGRVGKETWMSSPGREQCSRVSLNKQGWCSSLVLMSANERSVTCCMLTAREF